MLKGVLSGTGVAAGSREDVNGEIRGIVLEELEEIK